MIVTVRGYISAMLIVAAGQSVVSDDNGITVSTDPEIPETGQSITLICTLLGHTFGDQNWLRNDELYSSDCKLNVHDANHNVSCNGDDTSPFRQYNFTIQSLDRDSYDGNWTCKIFGDQEYLEIVVIDRANTPVWQPETPVYVADTINNLTCSTSKSAIPVPVFTWWTASSCDVGGINHTGEDWLGDDGNFMNTWSYKPNRADDGVCIWCEVRQHVLRQTSAKRTVDIMYPPLAANSSASHTVVIVDHQPVNVSLVCEIAQGGEGNPPDYNFTWNRTNGVIKGRNPNEGTLTFSMNRSEVCFDDVYTCTPSNTYGSGSPATINLIVLVDPFKVHPTFNYLNVTYDEDLSVKCEYHGRPAISVSWAGFNEDIYAVNSSSGTDDDCGLLEYVTDELKWGDGPVDARKNGNGPVSCIAVSPTFRIKTTSVFINVQYPPLRSMSRSVHVTATASSKPAQYTIGCFVDDADKGNPDVYTYTWHRQHGDVSDYDPESGNLTLTLDRGSIDLDDVYTCEPRNEIGNGSSALITFTVQVVPEYEGQNYSQLLVINTDSLDVPCQYIARPEPSVTWSDYNERVYTVSIQVNENVTDPLVNTSNNRPLLTRSHMNLTWGTEDIHVRKRGSGRVTCSADNGVEFPENHTLDIEVLYIPESPSLRFNESVVYAGTMAELTCEFTPGPDGSDGNPPVTEYTWLFESRAFPVDTRGDQITMGIRSIQQEGNYACYGTNYPLDVQTNGSESDPKSLTVNVLPYIVEPQENDTLVILYDDSNTAMHCLGAGKPEIDFTWYRNEVKVRNVDFLIQNEHTRGNYSYDLRDGWRSKLRRKVAGVYFTCDNITKYDGLYQCEAYHPGRVSTKSPAIQLITQYPAHWAGPVLHPTHYTSPGGNLTLLCDVCMEPRGNITWYMNGEPVRDNVSITDDGRNLTLTDVQLEDFGNYTCQVTNIILDENYTESFDISLVERGAPHPPDAFQVDDSTSRSLNVSWLPGSTGGYDSQTFTLCYVTHDVHPSCQVGITGGSDAISKSLGDLKANTTYQLKLYAENAHHGNNRSSLAEMNNSTKVAPVIKIVDFDLSATHVIVTWVVEAGEPSYLTLVHCPAEDCDVTTQRLRRDVKPTWRELATNIPPDEESYTYEAQEGESFDVYSRNRFNLWAYEPGLNDRSNTDDDDAIWDVLPLSPGVDIGLVVGIVLAVVAAAVLVTGGFVYYRKKAAKGPSHREIGQGSLGMSPEGVGNPGYDDSDDIEPYGEVSFNDPPLSEPAASSKDLPSDVVKYAQVVKPKKKAKAAADASAVYAIVDKTQKKTKTPDPVPEDETQDPYENVDFPKNKIEYLDKEPYYLSKDGLIYVNLLKKGPEVIHETAYEPSDYKTIDWVRTAQINKHPRPPTPPDTPPPRAEKYDDEEDIFGPLPFQAKEEEEQDGDFDEENVDYEDDGTRPSHAPLTASMTQHSRREQVPEGAVGGVEDHEMDSGHSSPRGQFFSGT